MRYLVSLSILLWGTFSGAMDEACKIDLEKWKIFEGFLEKGDFKDIEDLVLKSNLDVELDFTDAERKEDLEECFKRGDIDLKQYQLSELAQGNLVKFIKNNRRETRTALLFK